MRKLFGLLAAVCFVFAFAGASFAQDAAAPAPATTETAAPAAVPAPAEFTGVVSVTPADAAKNETAATIVLTVGEKAYKLVAADAAKATELEALNGKTVTVKGTLVAAVAPELESIQVAEFAEAAAAPAADAPKAE